jgi:hypothetical protein
MSESIDCLFNKVNQFFWQVGHAVSSYVAMSWRLRVTVVR